MPRLSDSMEEGTILKWLVDEGGEVKRGEPLVEIETDKANMTYEADTDGTLVEVVASEGDTLPVGEVIARIGDAGEAKKGDGDEKKEKEPEEEEQEEPSGSDGAAPEEDEGDGDGDEGDAGEEAEEAEEEEPATATATAEEEEQKPKAPSENGDGRVKASPVARRMAGELGVELARLEGSGPGGRIVKADVEAAAQDGAAVRERPAAEEEGAAPEPAAAGEGPKGETTLEELTRLQQTVSRRMAESKATAPEFALHMEIDMTACVEVRRQLKEVADPAPSFNDMVVKACARALREHPKVNGSYRDGKFELYSRVNVGIAVAGQGTLVVPNVFDADRKSLGVIADEARGLIEKVHDGSITPPELSGGTFTVSNLGMYGIESFTAVINPPQAAILTVGALKKKPVVDADGAIVARDMMAVTLVSDHRILYGADAAQFLSRVRDLLERPAALAL